jgi:hypothetical protein
VHTRLQLGAPGIYSPPPDPIRALTGARMDVCGFVGVAPRGPARRPAFPGVEWAERPCEGNAAAFPRSVAVPVESFDEYRRLYGGFEGPGLLPYAVASFFENGGLRAYVVRVVPAYGGGPDAGLPFTATGTFTRVRTRDELRDGASPAPLTDAPGAEPIELRARSEGAWGNALAARLDFTTRPVAVEPHGPRSLRLLSDLALPVGTLLRFAPPFGAPALRWVTALREEWDPGARAPARSRIADLDRPLLAPLEPGARVEVVEGSLELRDRATTERLGGLGLDAAHPRWLAKIVYQDSRLAYPAPGWIDAALAIDDPALPPYEIARFEGGRDDWAAISPEDLFDAGWTPGDECPGAGVHALVGLPDLAAVCVPDLYSPEPLSGREDVVPAPPRCGPTFERAVAAPRLVQAPPPPAELAGLRLDPLLDLDAIAALQRRLVELAELVRGFVVLLDVPPRLDQRRILRWRGLFASAYAAAYHPWLKVSRPDDAREAPVRVPPSAVAAGIIARRELAVGIPHGAANVLAEGVVDVEERVSPARHDELHPAGVNVFLKERDGVRLTAARTLSRDPAYRQLSVRRLVLMLRRTLDGQLQWAAFEPNGPALRRDVRGVLVAYLRELWRANAFTGATEAEAFFVRCDDELNPRRLADQGRLVCEVGVAPAEPLEFIVLRVERGGDGTLRVEG